MNSTLGVPGDTVPLTVRLQLDDRQETQVLKLKLVPGPRPATCKVEPTN